MLTRRTLLGQLGAVALLAKATWEPASAASVPRPEDDDAEAVTSWADLLLRLIQNSQGFTPPVAARAIGYFGVTIYETIVIGSDTHRPLHSVLPTMVEVADPGEPERRPLRRGAARCPTVVRPTAADLAGPARWSLAANVAAGTIVRSLFPRISADDRVAIEDLEASNRARFARGVPSETVARS